MKEQNIVRVQGFITLPTQPIEAELANGNKATIPAEQVSREGYSRIWKSAVVVKNKREADGGGIMLTIQQSLASGAITKEEAFDIMVNKNKEKIAELKALLPTAEKSEEPSDGDIEVAINQYLAGKGQAS